MLTNASRIDDYYRVDERVKLLSLDMPGGKKNIVSIITLNIFRVFALRKVLIDKNIKFALAFMTASNSNLALAAVGLKGLKTIGSEHSFPPNIPEKNVLEFLRRYSYGLLTAVIALTTESRSWILQNTRADNVMVIPNPVIYPLPDNEPVVNPGTIMVDEKKHLLAVGRLAQEKGFEMLIEAFSVLAHRFPDWDLIILGEGPLFEELTGMIQNTYLTGRVKMPGLIGNIAAWYEKADIFVMSSRFEGFPNTLIEAMSYGLPAVSFDCDTGPRDIIRHEVDGLLVPPENINAFVGALDSLMRDESQRKEYSKRAIEVRERFSLSSIMAKWDKLIEDIN